MAAFPAMRLVEPKIEILFLFFVMIMAFDSRP